MPNTGCVMNISVTGYPVQKELRLLAAVPILLRFHRDSANFFKTQEEIERARKRFCEKNGVMDFRT